MHIKTAPMGWNTWNTFGGEINEELIMQSADAMVEKGYKDAGYEYVVIDDCWAEHERDENGCLVADHVKFPHGMKYVADYVHSKGLKFGMYSCAGILTCARFPSSFGYEFVDAKTFASWGVDYLKYDFCNFPNYANGKHSYLTMSNALRTCGRDILFSACNWGVDSCWEWMDSIGAHMYRSTGDIFDSFESIKNIATSRIDTFNLSGPGCFNDIDMLTCGMYGKGLVGRNENACGDIEYKTHFALWCILSAPLMMGGDIRNLSDYCRKLLTNKELIRINQDLDARQPIRIGGDNSGDRTLRLFKLLENGEYALGMFNIGEEANTSTFYPTEVGFPNYAGAKFIFTDVFTGEQKEVKGDFYEINLAPHDCAMYRIKVVY